MGAASKHLRESLILSTGYAGDDKGDGTNDVLLYITRPLLPALPLVTSMMSVRTLLYFLFLSPQCCNCQDFCSTTFPSALPVMTGGGESTASFGIVKVAGLRVLFTCVQFLFICYSAGVEIVWPCVSFFVSFVLQIGKRLYSLRPWDFPVKPGGRKVLFIF